MATVIRFARHGTKKRPFFRIVVQDKTSPRDGRFIENIGNFNPIKGPSSLSVSRERLEYWLGTGAQLSESVKNRLSVLRRQWATGVATQGQAATPTPSVPKKEMADKPAKAKSAKKASSEKSA